MGKQQLSNCLDNPLRLKSKPQLKKHHTSDTMENTCTFHSNFRLHCALGLRLGLGLGLVLGYRIIVSVSVSVRVSVTRCIEETRSVVVFVKVRLKFHVPVPAVYRQMRLMNNQISFSNTKSHSEIRSLLVVYEEE